MSSSKITLTGFTQWMKAENDDLWAAFDDLPTGIDKDTLVQNILLRGGEFEVIYSNPYFMQEAMVPWVTKWSRTIEKWITALAIEYDPLSNYDRNEEWSDTGTGTKNSTGTSSETSDMTGGEVSTHEKGTSASTEFRSDGTDTNNGSTTNEVSAFDSNSYQAHDKSTVANGTTTATESTTTTTNAGTDSDVSSTNAQESRSGSTSNDESSVTQQMHSGRIYGNIGVTTSQQMLQSELDIAMFNLYDRVTDLFLAEFIIPVYY